MGRLALVIGALVVGLAAGVEIAVAGGVTAVALCRSVTRGGGSRVGRTVHRR